MLSLGHEQEATNQMNILLNRKLYKPLRGTVSVFEEHTEPMYYSQQIVMNRINGLLFHSERPEGINANFITIANAWIPLPLTCTHKHNF